MMTSSLVELQPQPEPQAEPEPEPQAEPEVMTATELRELITKNKSKYESMDREPYRLLFRKAFSAALLKFKDANRSRMNA
jgi:hypothetical protein